jgi:hypothetical protein
VRFVSRQLQGPEDVPAVLVLLDRDALDVDARRGSVTVAERVLRLGEAPRTLRHQTREGVARLVEVNLPDPGLAGVTLEVLSQ